LLWNRSAPVVRTATHAILWIGDGRAQTKLDIDPKQLSGGSIVYWPRSRDITFRMEIFAPNLFGSESLATAVMHQKPPDASPATLKVAESTTPAPASAIAVPSPETPPITPPRRAPFQKKHYRALPELSAVSASPAMPLFPDPPEIASGPVSDSEALLFSESDILKTRLPEISDPFVSVTIDPLSESRRGGLLGKLPLIGKRHKPSGFVPPTPVHEAPTNVPPEVRHRTKHEVPIDVKLYVDRAGIVEHVELLSKGTGPDRDLASLAVLSSRRWQFAPARLGDESVPAEVVLRFRFGPEVH
jgi:hypothetical protein